MELPTSENEIAFDYVSQSAVWTVMVWEEGIVIPGDTYEQTHIVTGTIPGYWPLHSRIPLRQDLKKNNTRQQN